MFSVRFPVNDPAYNPSNTTRVTVGEIYKTNDETLMQWTIPNFSSLSLIAGTCYYSQDFAFSKASWRLKVYPKGRKTNDEWISLYLERVDAGPPLSLRYRFYVKTTTGKDHHFLQTAIFSKKDSVSGCSKFLPRSDFLSNKSKLAPSDILTLVCCLKNNDPAVVSRTEELSIDLKKLVLSTDDSDVKAIVRGEEFPLHRAILRARTPVFDCMFKHQMQEKETGIVRIDDCEPTVFRSFLEYIYSGGIQDLTPRTAIGLYGVADKYQLFKLKHDCLVCITAGLSVETFCDVINLALRHDEQKLVELATDFFLKYTKKIIVTPEWLKYVQENTAEANKLFMKVLLNKEKKRTTV